MWGKCIFASRQWRVWLICLLTLVSCFHETNHPPTANAGANVSAPIKSTITLDASLSSDVDGDSIDYQWEITEKPENSFAQLSDAKSMKPQLILDVVGEYVIKLVVSDGKKSSKADFVTISTYNEQPIAIIVEASVRNGSHYVIGDSISVNASQSSDPENETIFYNWEFSVKPEGSLAVLSSNTSVNPSFVVDLPGHYIVHLVVSDGTNLSEPVMMIFEIEQPRRKTDTRPFAEAGPDQPLYIANTLIQLDGSRSYDLENDSLNYRWEMILKPEGSVALLLNENNVSPQFTADVMGNYVIKLVVSDLSGESHLDTVIVTPHETPSLACGDCHENLNANGKPTTHQLTFDDCFQCHFFEGWKPAKGVVHFHSHNAQPAQCDICHNGVEASGKSADHIVTDKDCNGCHRLSNGTWVPAFTKPVAIEFSHKGIYSGCTACHDNQFQKGKPIGHMPTSDRCFACHVTDKWASRLHLEHTQALDFCDRCHDGIKAKGKPPVHVATSLQCGQCHQKTTWINPIVAQAEPHPEFTGPCSACHDKPDQFALNQHLPTSNVCEQCHNIIAWSPVVTVDHEQVIGSCIDCHNNVKGKAGWKKVLHTASTNNCAACHKTNQFAPVILVDHNENTGACVSCHNKKIAKGRSTSHINATENCDQCHSTTVWQPAIMLNHKELIGQCYDCHDNSLVMGKSVNHVSASEKCEACHFSTTFFPVMRIDQIEKGDQCVDCHFGTLASGKPSTHIRTTDDCKYCHTRTSFAAKEFLPHVFMLGSCAECHNGNIASGKPAVHTSPSDSCGDVDCHSTMQWKVLKPADHILQTNNCQSCHNGLVATGKFVTHITATDACGSCHKNNSWIPVNTVDHANLLGSCANCHTSQPRDHIITTNRCEACHSTQSFTPIVSDDHTQLLGRCFTCHNGTLARGKGVSHISTTNVCEACHSTTSFLPLLIFDHAQAIDSCVTCHNGVVASGKSPNHITSDHECEGCHVVEPLSWKIVSSTVHFYINLPCTNCHIAPNQHLAVGVVDQCESCHIAASWGYPARTLVQ